MKFIKDIADKTPINDTLFTIVRRAKADIAVNGDKVINATIGSLFNEDAELVAMESVFDGYDEIDDKVKAAYAQSFVGNKEYVEAVDKWLYQDIDLKLKRKTMATIGGSGAITVSFLNVLDPGDTVIYPNIYWSSYKLMADQYNLQSKTYNILKDGSFDIESFKETLKETAKNQNRLLVVINDPCHNPTGYSMSEDEWKEVIETVNEISRTTPVVILNDIAYIDFSFKDNSRKYMEQFNKISDNVSVFTAFSISKSLTSYGLRCGALVIMTQKQEDVDDTFIVFEKSARGVWSNVPNAAMVNFCKTVEDNRDRYIAEKAMYIDLLKQRSDLFKSEADECGLPYYNYQEGFFITLKLDNETRDKLHVSLMDNHIYTIKTNMGIRVAICSTPLRKIKGLAFKIKDLLDKIDQ